MVRIDSAQRCGFGTRTTGRISVNRLTATPQPAEACATGVCYPYRLKRVLPLQAEACYPYRLKRVLPHRLKPVLPLQAEACATPTG
jgi:hypothetical protein